ncbi:MAG: ChbG/HpnK family deacetylase [Acidimicrobiales bacterium]
MSDEATAQRAPILIVNADDYGLTSGVSAGILRAHGAGVVTSTSVLAVAPAFARTAPWLADHCRLGVGVHLAAVGEDPPLLSAAEVPTLVDRSGRFPASWRVLLPRLLAGRVDPDDLRSEFTAQLEAAQGYGIQVSHLDTHQHVHLWPSVASVVIDLARRTGIGAVRVPRSHRAGLVSMGLNRLAGRLAAAARSSTLRYPADASGLDEAGRFDQPALAAALDRFVASGAASAEVNAHPGEDVDGERDRYRWDYRWGEELAVLTSTEARRAIEERGFTLGTYASLAP